MYYENATQNHKYWFLLINKYLKKWNNISPLQTPDIIGIAEASAVQSARWRLAWLDQVLPAIREFRYFYLETASKMFPSGFIAAS